MEANKRIQVLNYCRYLSRLLSVKQLIENEGWLLSAAFSGT